MICWEYRNPAEVNYQSISVWVIHGLNLSDMASAWLDRGLDWASIIKPFTEIHHAKEPIISPPNWWWGLKIVPKSGTIMTWVINTRKSF
jgi:hypothetical protein